LIQPLNAKPSDKKVGFPPLANVGGAAIRSRTAP
jgi:hypothetical protein